RGTGCASRLAGTAHVPLLCGSKRAGIHRHGRALLGPLLRRRPGLLHPGRSAAVPARRRSAYFRPTLDCLPRGNRLAPPPPRRRDRDRQVVPSCDYRGPYSDSTPVLVEGFGRPKRVSRGRQCDWAAPTCYPKVVIYLEVSP